jgi:hypothetical protein
MSISSTSAESSVQATHVKAKRSKAVVGLDLQVVFGDAIKLFEGRLARRGNAASSARRVSAHHRLKIGHC